MDAGMLLESKDSDLSYWESKSILLETFSGVFDKWWELFSLDNCTQ